MNGLHLSEVESDGSGDNDPDIYAWGVSLTRSSPEATWQPFSDEDEDDEAEEYRGGVHHLIVKQAVLASSAKDGERNVINFQTYGFDNQPIDIPFISLLRNHKEMCTLDMKFEPCGYTGVKFKLVEGSGPVYLTGEHHTEAEEASSDEESESFSPIPKLPVVKKASAQKAKISPKIKAAKKPESNENIKKAAEIKGDAEQKVRVKKKEKDSTKVANDTDGVENMINGLSIVQKKNTRSGENDKKATTFNSDGFKPEGIVKRKKAVE